MLLSVVPRPAAQALSGILLGMCHASPRPTESEPAFQQDLQATQVHIQVHAEFEKL